MTEEQRERRRAYKREWKFRNPESYQASRERYKPKLRAYAAAQYADPEKRKLKLAWERRQRVKFYGAQGDHTEAEWESLKQACDYRCLGCGLKEPLTADHIIPLSIGGTDYIDNIQPLCRKCNSGKHASVKYAVCDVSTRKPKLISII
jgi:5-methylcytosine-specific restriction endonuclease McrA